MDAPAFARALDEYLTRTPEEPACSCAMCCRDMRDGADALASAAEAALVAGDALRAGDPLCEECVRNLAADAAKLRAEPDLTVAVTTRCPWCREDYVAATGEVVTDRGADVLGLKPGTVLCPGCAKCADDDAETEALSSALGAAVELGLRWVARAEGREVRS